MDRFRVVIAGGGIAALEGLLRLRRLVGDSVDVVLLAPDEELRYRPLAVDEPFARRRVARFPTRVIARRTKAEWVQDTLEWLDPDAQAVHRRGAHAGLRRAAAGDRGSAEHAAEARHHVR